MQSRVSGSLHRTGRCEPGFDSNSIRGSILRKNSSSKESLSTSSTRLWILLRSGFCDRRHFPWNVWVPWCDSLRCRDSDASSSLQLHNLYGSKERRTIQISNLSWCLSQESSVFLQIYRKERTTSSIGIYGLRSFLRRISVSLQHLFFHNGADTDIFTRLSFLYIENCVVTSIFLPKDHEENRLCCQDMCYGIKSPLTVLPLILLESFSCLDVTGGRKIHSLYFSYVYRICYPLLLFNPFRKTEYWAVNVSVVFIKWFMLYHVSCVMERQGD
jgi:hypothetical protein